MLYCCWLHNVGSFSFQMERTIGNTEDGVKAQKPNKMEYVRQIWNLSQITLYTHTKKHARYYFSDGANVHFRILVALNRMIEPHNLYRITMFIWIVRVIDSMHEIISSIRCLSWTAHCSLSPYVWWVIQHPMNVHK